MTEQQSFLSPKNETRQEYLVRVLNQYAYDYYVLEKPIVSDFDYDKLYDELVEIESSTGVVLPSSPTIRVGGEVLSGFKKVEHKVQLYSLNKCNDYAGLEKFLSDVRTVVPDAKFVVEYKFDGLRIIAHYKGGLLVQASTRGNGLVGEDVTEQVKTIKSVPLQIEFKGDVTVAGEGVITLQNLEKYNKTAEEKLKNARNAVAGAIRNLDPKVTAKRNLDVVFYDIISTDNEDLKTQVDVENFLKQNKFLTGKLFKLCSTIDEITKIADKVDKEKSSLDIQIDGLVLKLNNLKDREELGFTAKFPKWAIAYKFAPVELTSTLKDVLWNVGRTGKVTPTAVIDPITLAGATVTRATLNNYDDILRKRLQLNSLVFVRRSNEVIPEILGLAHDNPSSTLIEKPTFCPCCHSTLVEIGPNLFCENPDCKDKVVAKIAYFASRNCMDIEGLSDKIVEVLFDHCSVRNFSDLYSLTPADLQNLEGFKDKKIDNLIVAINNSKNCKLNNFISALSIENVGEKTSKDLSRKFGTLDNLIKATKEELLEVKDIGEVVAGCIVDFFSKKTNLDEIERLKHFGVQIGEEKLQNIDKSNFFYGKTFVLTGTLENYKRQDATSLIESFGGNVSGSVSKNTSYVLVGADAGSKLDKAKALGVPILTEQEFAIQILKNQNKF
jgi:DNA ligase (NAD+)